MSFRLQPVRMILLAACAALALPLGAQPLPRQTPRTGDRTPEWPLRTRIVPHATFATTRTVGDLDGDGKAEQLAIVHILARTPQRQVDPALVVANPWDSDAPAQALPAADQPMALILTNSATGTRHLLHSDYIALSANLFKGAPVRAERKGTATFRDFRRDCPAMRHDYLLMATEAGIDIALFWNGRRYEVCWPNETP